MTVNHVCLQRQGAPTKYGFWLVCAISSRPRRPAFSGGHRRRIALSPPAGALRPWGRSFPRAEARGYITAALWAQGRLTSRPYMRRRGSFSLSSSSRPSRFPRRCRHHVYFDERLPAFSGGLRRAAFSGGRCHRFTGTIILCRTPATEVSFPQSGPGLVKRSLLK
jgi:hypothetical protein